MSFGTQVNRVWLGSAVAFFVFAGGVYAYYSLFQKFTRTRAELAARTEKADRFEASLASSTHDNTELSEALTAEQDKNQQFINQIQQIQGTVGTLVKLSKTDPELLKKYSKVYFLNENYIPALLALINPANLSEPTRGLKLNADVAPFMEQMLEAAKKDGVEIKIASAYRSFAEQSSLKSAYKVTYGSGANKFSADQGYSEHQLGTTADFTTSGLGGQLLGFEKTNAYIWLLQHGHEYGFILSYPSGNAYYQYEPWHWRFVGIALAATLHDTGKSFYDLDQRSIDPFLITLFDPQ